MSRAARFLLAATLVALTGTAAAAEAPPLLTLVYTANSFGVFRACPVCGSQALGGLGRRATVFRELREEFGDSALFLAGPYEFAPVVVRRPESPELARALARAYGLLGYDLGVVAPAEEGWLAASGAAPPPRWRVLGDRPQTVTLARAGVRVAVVLFPAADPAREPARTRELLDSVRTEALVSRAGADLVLGAGPWGEEGERMLLEAAPGVFDLILGAGRGHGQGVRPMAQGRTLWLRPPFDGRGLVVCQVRALPQGPDRAWRSGIEYEAGVRMLEQGIPEAEAVTQVFNRL